MNETSGGPLVVPQKPWWTSKTIWFNILALLAVALVLPEVHDIIPDGWERFVAAFVAVANLVLRFASVQPIGKGGTS